jgi:hypothetical protein
MYLLFTFQNENSAVNVSFVTADFTILFFFINQCYLFVLSVLSMFSMYSLSGFQIIILTFYLCSNESIGFPDRIRTFTDQGFSFQPRDFSF